MTSVIDTQASVHMFRIKWTHISWTDEFRDLLFLNVTMSNVESKLG
jgi:hypothetical protein